MTVKSTYHCRLKAKKKEEGRAAGWESLVIIGVQLFRRSKGDEKQFLIIPVFASFFCYCCCLLSAPKVVITTLEFYPCIYLVVLLFTDYNLTHHRLSVAHSPVEADG